MIAPSQHALSTHPINRDTCKTFHWLSTCNRLLDATARTQIVPIEFHPASKSPQMGITTISTQTTTTNVEPFYLFWRRLRVRTTKKGTKRSLGEHARIALNYCAHRSLVASICVRRILRRGKKQQRLGRKVVINHLMCRRCLFVKPDRPFRETGNYLILNCLIEPSSQDSRSKHVQTPGLSCMSKYTVCFLLSILLLLLLLLLLYYYYIIILYYYYYYH